MSPDRVAFYWRQTREGVTGELKAVKVAELPNPGSIYSFHGQLYRLRDNQLILCTPDEARKIRSGIVEKRA